MSGFKHNSSRFNNSRDSGDAENRERSQNNYSKKADSRPTKGKSKFTRLGSLTVPKTMDEELRKMIVNELRGSEVRLTLKVFPPRGVETVNLRRNDVVSISFKVFDDEPAFVVGTASIPNND